MKVLRLLLLFLLVSVSVPAVASSGTASAPAIPRLVDVRAAHHPGFDRIVFEFAGGLPSSRQVGYVDELIADGSGRPVRIAGQAILQVRFEPAVAHNRNGPTARRRTAFALPNVMTAVRSGDFEAVTTYGIGLAKRTRFQVRTLQNPSRVVIDVRAAFRTVNRKVYFLNRDRFVANQQPFFTPRWRPVRPVAPATGVMDRLFAGPLASERADGLRLLRSRAKSYADLEIARRIARVRLTGGCNSGGSTVTVAGEIMPTLKALDTVGWVKIYSPRGQTARPGGRTDSIPACLEP